MALLTKTYHGSRVIGQVGRDQSKARKRGRQNGGLYLGAESDRERKYMPPAQKLSFHDSTIISVRREDDSVVLVVKDVAIGDGFGDAVGRGTVRFVGVLTITRDGCPVDDLVPVYEDGEIWTLDHKTDVVALIVDWTDYKTHRSQTHCYQITCRSVQVDIR